MCNTSPIKNPESLRMDPDGRKIEKVETEKGTNSLWISPLCFLLTLVASISLSYHAGRQYRQTHLVDLSQFERNATSERQRFLASAQYRRRKVTMIHDSCSEECSATREITVEEILFDKGFYKHYRNDEEENNEDQGGKNAAIAHVIVDIERVTFNMDSIREAMLETIWEASRDFHVSMLSIYCQETPQIICSALLDDGHHMTASANPSEEVCSIDIMFGEKDDAPAIMKIVERIFHAGDADPLFRFRVVLRGEGIEVGHYLDDDLGKNLMAYKNHFYFKKEYGFLQSDVQRIDIWEGLDIKLQSVSGYEKSLVEAGKSDYYTQNRALFRPNRMLFMDGVLQSSIRGDEPYHESLVHPSMFASVKGPERVAIIGGGEGATLREILKHKSVEVCMMIEIDPGIVQAARDWLPEMNDCSDFGSGNCFDENRTDLRCEDAFSWFSSRFNTNDTVSDELKTDPFDVIIMDALDPEDTVEFAVMLYQDLQFWATLHNALTENGVLVVQLGRSPEYNAYAEQYGKYSNRATLFNTIDLVGFEMSFIYHDSHSDFKNPWTFMVACKSGSCAKEWSSNEAQVDLRIRERILPSKSGASTLKYFDGATMQLYQRPPKRWENAHCKKVPKPIECSLPHKSQQIHFWWEVFDITSSVDGKILVTMKLHLEQGSIVRVVNEMGLTSSSFLWKDVSDSFAELTKKLDTLASCSIVRNLTRFESLGKVSPLVNREPNLFTLRILTRRVAKGEVVTC